MKKILLIIFMIIIFIEAGMRLSIGYELNKITPASGEYQIDIERLDWIEMGYAGCIGHSDHNYLAIPYTLWLMRDVIWGDIICRYRSWHINVYYKIAEKHMEMDYQESMNYHWSFMHWRFIDTDQERSDKLEAKQRKE